jgi:phage baseplate assembly protein W
MQLGSTQGQGLLVQTFSMADQVGDNLRNLLLTNWGERLFQYNFGANLRPLTTEYTNIDDFDSKAFDNIKNAVSTWMPYIDLDGYQSNVNRINNTNTAIIAITITYDVPSLQVKGAQVTITLYVI